MSVQEEGAGLEPARDGPVAARPVWTRYHIDSAPAPDRPPLPPRFQVRVSKVGLARLLLREMIHYRGNWKVVSSRPCVYGVFSGPVGGFAPRQHLCVGCLRCTTQHPEVVQILPNPARAALGDSYFRPEIVVTVDNEARTGQVPVRGAGYRGPFSGPGWDQMWTDMSEIVRPTRDGIHGREFISTVTDIGLKPPWLTFDAQGRLVGPSPRTFSIPLPLLFDRLPASLQAEPLLQAILARAARETGTLALVALPRLLEFGLQGEHLVPVVGAGPLAGLARLPFAPQLVEIEEGQPRDAAQLAERLPATLAAFRLPLGPGLVPRILEALDQGVGVFHLVASYHGRGTDGRFVMDLVREVHTALVEAGRREEVTLLGSGGIIAAEHLPKALLCGLDAVALDTTPLVALQLRFQGTCDDARRAAFRVPRLEEPWGVQRLKNLLASWRDQLLEVMGAMGMREARRLRGESGRAMFCSELEREAFGEIEGYEPAP
jgi:hypothetical protein